MILKQSPGIYGFRGVSMLAYDRSIFTSNQRRLKVRMNAEKIRLYFISQLEIK